METQYKKIFLKNGLEKLSEYQFRTVKCFWATPLSLTSEMQENCDRIQITYLMFDKFLGAECVNQLIKAIEGDRELEELATSLRRQLEEAQGRTSAQVPSPGPSSSAGSTTSAQVPSPGSSSSAGSTTSAQDARPQEPPQARASSHILQETPILAKVLQVSELFEITAPSGEERRLFHSTVATTDEFFPVKVFSPQLMDKFVRNKVLRISNYVRAMGFLEVTGESSVTEVTQEVRVPRTVLEKAKKCPQIRTLHTLASGTVLSGLFTLSQKLSKRTRTVYEIEDNTGTMDLVCTGRYFNLPCHRGDKLRLFGVRLRILDQKKVLLSEEDSFIQVIKRRRSQSSTLPGASAANLNPTPARTSSGQTESASRLVGTFQEESQQDQLKEIVVLDVTEPFRYHEDFTMFHAIVSIKDQAHDQIIHVKVFHEGFKTMFVLGNNLVLSNYVDSGGFLEVYEFTSVEKLWFEEVPDSLYKMATETPKISHLRQEAPHTIVNGVFWVAKKVVRHPCVYYEVQDETGTMQVVVHGHLTGIPCERGNSIRLICFERGEDQNEIRSLIHSFLKVF